MDNYKMVTPLKFWVQKVLPLVYDDSLSYYELLNKVVIKLNDLISNNEELPKFVSDLIEEYITSGAIGEVVRNILADYMLNVKNPPEGLTPAVGDGSADDTQAIQGCIDYANANGGKAIYFPSGRYLTSSLIMKSNVALVGFDRYSTRVVLRGGSLNPLFTGNCENVTINRVGLDGNADIQTENLNLVEITGKNFIFNDVTLTDGYELLKVTLTGNIQLNNVVFKHAVINGLVTNGVGIVQGNNLVFESLSDLLGKHAILNSVANAVFTNVTIGASAINPINNNGNNVCINATITSSSKEIINTGANCNITINGYSSNENYTSKKTIKAEQVIVESNQPLGYKAPTEYNRYFKTVPFKNNNEEYHVLVKGADDIELGFSEITNNITMLNEKIDEETLNRQTNDTLIQECINQEIDNRIGADETLQELINLEKQERENSFNELQTNIENETISRQETYDILQQNIDIETQNRNQAVLTLQSNIDNEKEEREADISNLSALIDELAFIKKVKIFDGLSDGVTDITLELQNAVNENDVIIIPPSDNFYLVSNTINVANNKKIIGINKPIIRNNNTSNFPIFTIKGTSSNKVKNITLDGLSIRNGTSSESNYILGKDGVIVEHAENITIKNCYIHEIQGAYGCKVKHTKGFNFIKNKTYRCTYSHLYFLIECENLLITENIFDTTTSLTTSQTYLLGNGGENLNEGNFFIKNSNILNNYFYNNPRWEGINSHGGTNILVENNYVSNCKVGIACFSTDGFVVDGGLHEIIVRNNKIVNPPNNVGSGILISGSLLKKAKNATIVNNYINGYGGSNNNNNGAITTYLISNVHIINNTINSFLQYGVCLYHTVYNCTIENNLFGDCLGGFEPTNLSLICLRAYAVYILKIKNNRQVISSEIHKPIYAVRNSIVNNRIGCVQYENNTFPYYVTAEFNSYSSIPLNKDTVPTLMTQQRNDKIKGTNGLDKYIVTSPSRGIGSNVSGAIATIDAISNTNTLNIKSFLNNRSIYDFVPNLAIVISGAGIGGTDLNAVVIDNNQNVVIIDTPILTSVSDVNVSYQQIDFQEIYNSPT